MLSRFVDPRHIKHQYPLHLHSRQQLPVRANIIPLSEHYTSNNSSEIFASRGAKWFGDFSKESPSAAAIGVHASDRTGICPQATHLRPSDLNSASVNRVGHYTAYSIGKTDINRDDEIPSVVADIIVGRRCLLQLCHALMSYGAPSHRLEAYLYASAAALRIEGTFQYLPGSMLISFGESMISSSKTLLIRELQGVNLRKFQEAHAVYKCVVHGIYPAEEALEELEQIASDGSGFGPLSIILAFGASAVSVSPWAFASRPIDFVPIFVLGCLLGIFLVYVPSKSMHIHPLFEVFATAMTSFIARALGSIYYNGEPLFCFSAMAQSSIALFLPGYIVFCAALELQGHDMVTGSVRMVYAIIYSLLLGFGIFIGISTLGKSSSVHFLLSSSSV